MPDLTRACIKAALVWLVVALIAAVATAMPAAAAWPWPRLAAALRPAAVHMLTVGWITQLIFGVALWMFPRHSPETPYGDPRLGWVLLICLNTGLLLRVLAEPAVMLAPGAAGGTALAISGLLQWTAGVLFAVLIWPRVRRR